jgi:hypothetical protein
VQQQVRRFVLGAGAAVLMAASLLAGCAAEGDADPEASASRVVRDGTVAGSDPNLTRTDVDCSAEGLGDDDEVAFEVAHLVVDGQLGEVCFGDEDDRLLLAWDDLVTITPPEQLNDLAVFAGFGADEEGDEQTLAFVNATDDEGETFQMSINLDAYDDDDTVALLTIAHEFAHVFTQVPSQIDRSEEAFEVCSTYRSAAGCFASDSLIAAWVSTFWTDQMLASIDPDAESTVAEGEERCAADPSFLGPYAASDPEEDFAESFSAYVFDVAVDQPEQQAKLDWLADQPGLAAFRARAEAAGLTPLDNPFESCG